MRAHRFARVLIPALTVLVLAPAGASAQASAEPTRQEYIAQAERICDVPHRRALRLLGTADALVESRRYVRAGKKTVRAARIALKVNARLLALDRPPSDATLLGRWLTLTRSGLKALVRSGRALKAKAPKRAEGHRRRANRLVRRGGAKVSAMAFRWCA